MSEEFRPADIASRAGDANVPPSKTPTDAIMRILFGAFRIGDDLGAGYRLADLRADGLIRVTATKGNVSLKMWICPTTADIPSYQATARFRIGYDGDLPEREARHVLDRLVEEVAQNEAGIPESTYRSAASAGLALDKFGDYGGLGDLQWLAVRAGLKPAARQIFDGTMVPAVIARARAAGLHVECLPATGYVKKWSDTDAWPGDTLVFVGASADAARTALEAERRLVRWSRDAWKGARTVLRLFTLRQRTESSDDDLGRALGYPSCCVQFFVPRVAHSIPDLTLAALERTEGPASFLLNNIDLHRALIPHYVCRYDCPASIDYARALLHEFERVDPPRATTLAESLRGLLVFFRTGGHMWLRHTTASEGQSWAFSGVAASGDWPARGDWVRAAEGSDRVALEGTHARFFRGATTVREFRLSADVGIARLFA
jgi:hypothetical protein